MVLAIFRVFTDVQGADYLFDEVNFGVGKAVLLVKGLDPTIFLFHFCAGTKVYTFRVVSWDGLWRRMSRRVSRQER